MIERRPIPRHNVNRIGTIAFVGGAVSRGIRNISPFGAALDVASTIPIPHEITLLLARRSPQPTLLRCLAKTNSRGRNVRSLERAKF